jgi:proteasome accessory factor B
VLGLAARFWQRVTLADASSRALVKLKSAATEPAAELVGIEPLVVRDERGFDVLWEAVNDRRVVEFDYRTRDGSISRRELEPWGLVSWHGRWYVIGHDRGRDAERVFRLGRVQGETAQIGKAGAFDPPANLDLRAAVREFEGPAPDRSIAELLVRCGSGVGLRRRATPATPTGPDGGGGAGSAPEGWDRLLVPYRDDYTLAEEVLGYGPDVVVIRPAEVRQLVRDRLAAVAGVDTPANGPAR